MFSFIKKVFESDKTDLTSLINQGAIILDVRSNAEYANGHINGAINIPLNTLRNELHKLKDKDKPIITCCASGNRSAAAENILKSSGYSNVHNGGGWQSLNQKIK